MNTIRSIRAIEVLDSRGNPTVECVVSLSNDSQGRFIVPSGASVGMHEAVELRDHDAKRFLGKGVRKALFNIEHHIAPALINGDAFDQSELDQNLIELDGTHNKSHLGANAILGVSVAFARAVAQAQGQPLYLYLAELAGNVDVRLPLPMMNILNGGAHANNNLDFQEFMIVPIGAPDMAAAVRCGAEVFHCLKRSLATMGKSTAVGDEGGFAPNFESNDEALDCLCEAIRTAGFELNRDVGLALDCAASEFYDDGTYRLKGQGVSLTGAQMCDSLKDLVNNYPIISIEDGMAENDWDSWQLLSESLGQHVQLVGDDIFVTNLDFFRKGIDRNIANSILIKVNQIGTLTETLQVINLAKEVGYTTVVSHRSGDTEDSFIADLAVGAGTGQIKTGSLSRSERTCKYNQLLRIEAEADHMEFRGLQEIVRHQGG